ncbi:hypothetical protein MNV49_003170 [Pseudohyphozyma bogoriensis]|nr:hypothetical protein MNV49_003170 [Pseudohyphozyma bogoriensis]
MIDRIHSSTYENFRTFLESNTPVLVSDTSASWPASRSWTSTSDTPNYAHLRTLYGALRVNVVDSWTGEHSEKEFGALLDEWEAGGARKSYAKDWHLPLEIQRAGRIVEEELYDVNEVCVDDWMNSYYCRETDDDFRFVGTTTKSKTYVISSQPSLNKPTHRLLQLTHPTFSLNHNWCNAHNIQSMYSAMVVEVASVRVSISDVKHMLKAGGGDDWEVEWEKCESWTTFWSMVRLALRDPEKLPPSTWPAIPAKFAPSKEFVVKVVRPILNDFKQRDEREAQLTPGLADVLKEVELELMRLNSEPV